MSQEVLGAVCGLSFLGAQTFNHFSRLILVHEEEALNVSGAHLRLNREQTIGEVRGIRSACTRVKPAEDTTAVIDMFSYRKGGTTISCV